MKLTEDLIRAAAQDAGNRSMRAGKRSKWNRDDFDAAVREYERLTAQPS